MVEIATEVRWQDHRLEIPMERIRLSEELGFDAVFTAGGYGCEELVELGYIAAQTSRLKIGTRITEVTGRAPAMAAMAFQTLNHLTGGGRVIAGLGTGSVPTAEGMQGRPWGRPVSRMRDFVTIMRQLLAGEKADHQGKEWSAPYQGPGARGAEPSAIGLVPLGEIPVMVGAAGPQMTTLAAEIGDGWMPASWAPGIMPLIEPLLQKGFERAGDGRSLKDFEIWGHVDMNVHDDVREAMRPFKEYVVTWSQMQHQFMAARGYPDLSATLGAIIAEATEAGAADDPRARHLEGRPMLDEPYWQRALDAVPDEYIDDGWLVGPVRRIRNRVAPWLDCGLTGVVFRYGDQLTHDRHVENLDAFRAVAAAAGRASFTG
ncbi:LLM class flavin-dependent oxidoreductase [Actinomadura welshii]|uniref:LLM class flavin-dependent oxidoreductase n=1 Tax=Actinomadura welshii TaxID=3103817 RepID=UPI0003AD0BD3|nr:LLM class flavin-dependent oxidoreductase [Actinomadura madurae]